jgi:hypothetical protein
MRSHAQTAVVAGPTSASTSAFAGLMEVHQLMRWRPAFMAEVFETLQQLGLRACPVCGSAESLSMSHFPVLMVDGRFPPEGDELPLGDYREGDLTFAVRIECAICGHLMLFNAQRHRNGDAKILEREIAEDSETPLWE